ncbi:MAG: hypothetical protein AAGM38_04070 [Pseudomonadota bacterium]
MIALAWARGATGLGAVMAALAAVAPAPTALAQTTDRALCDAPAAQCASALSARCVEALGAGALPATTEACADQVTAYRGCLRQVAETCGAARPASDARSCDAETARQLWASAERRDDCRAYDAFLSACPDQPQAIFARANRAHLGCEATNGAAARSDDAQGAPDPRGDNAAAATKSAAAAFLGRWEGAGETTEPCPGGDPMAALFGGAAPTPQICYDISADASGIRLLAGIALPELSGLRGGRSCVPSKNLPAELRGDRLVYRDIGGESVVRRDGDALSVTAIGRCLGDAAATQTTRYRLRRVE